ncbi:MAG: rod shape-determining protein MreD [Opitutaceae bacterium]
MRRTLVTFLTLFVLWVIVAQVNHALSGAHVYLFVAGLYVTYVALQLPLRDGLAAVLLAGLLCDATAPVPFGLHTLLFATAFAIIANIRDHVPREETVAQVIVALLTNLGLFLVFSFVLIGRSPSPGAVWPRLIVDLLCSQVLLALIAPWFFALQARVLVLARVERDHLV